MDSLNHAIIIVTGSFLPPYTREKKTFGCCRVACVASGRSIHYSMASRATTGLGLSWKVESEVGNHICFRINSLLNVVRRGKKSPASFSPQHRQIVYVFNRCIRPHTYSRSIFCRTHTHPHTHAHTHAHTLFALTLSLSCRKMKNGFSSSEKVVPGFLTMVKTSALVSIRFPGIGFAENQQNGRKSMRRRENGRGGWNTLAHAPHTHTLAHALTRSKIDRV